ADHEFVKKAGTLMIGQTIQHYEILEKLGEGGMGVVYKAEDTKLERTVAIKFLPRHIAADSEERQRFKIEAKAAAALNHPNIATIHAIEEVDDEMFMVMEHIEGRELRDIVGAENFQLLPLADVADYATQIASGLQAAHEKDVIHRDIKSANIMITDKGQVKIMDFGLAKVAGGAQLTKDQSTLGTAAYMSPEQARGEAADHRSDIWSFGVVLYEMLTGNLPFPGDYEQAVIYAILNEQPDFTDIPDEAARVVQKALAKQVQDRYQNAQDLLAEVENLKTGRNTSTEPNTRPTTKRWAFIVASLAVMALAAFLATFLFNSSGVDSVASTKSIAVLPFTDRSPTKDQEYFGDGMAEAVINALGQIPGLKVSARTSAFQFKGGEDDIQTIGEKLGVAAVLEGSVAKSGNKLRVTAQLVKVADGFHLWSDTYDRELTDIFAIQDDLSRSIVEALRVELSSDETEISRKGHTTNVEAYNLYLKGRYFWNRRTEEGLRKSIDYFQQTIDKDPTYALAYTGLADAYNMLALWQYQPPREAFPRAKSAAKKALEIDDSIAEAHTALAYVKNYYDWDWPGAERSFKRALALNPNYAIAHHWYSDLLAGLGRHKDARIERDKALELDPLSLIINIASGLNYLYAGQQRQAIRQAKRTLEMDANFIPAHFILFQAHAHNGFNANAFPPFKVSFSAFYELTDMQQEALEARYEDSGWVGVAHFMIAKHQELSEKRYLSDIWISLFYLMLEDHERSLDYMEKAYEIRNPFLVHLKGLPQFAALREEPRFQAIMKGVGIKE
ncbi:protein kinase, partial [bacterium]|nr:protein kinase [bacterium]